MSKSTFFYIQMAVVLVFWPGITARFSDLIVHSALSNANWFELITSVVLVGFSLIKVREGVIGKVHPLGHIETPIT